MADDFSLYADGGTRTKLDPFIVGEDRLGSGTLADVLGNARVAGFTTSTNLLGAQPVSTGGGAPVGTITPTTGVIGSKRAPSTYQPKEGESYWDTISTQEGREFLIDKAVQEAGGYGKISQERLDRIINDIYLDQEVAIERSGTFGSRTSQGGFPAVIPLPIDPALAAALTVLGLFGSRGGGAPSGSTSGATGATTGSTGPTGGSTGATGAASTGATGSTTGVTKGPSESVTPTTGGPGSPIVIGSIVSRADGDYRVEQDSNGQIIYVPVNRPSGPTGSTGPSGATGPGGEVSGPGTGVIFVGSGPTGVIGGTYTGPFEEMPDESWNVKDPEPTGPTGPPESCPTPEMTILMSDGASVPAGEVRPEMWVYTAHEHTGKWGSFKVVQASIHQAERLKIDTERGSISCSTSHKFKTYGGWIEAKDIKVGSVISDHRVIAVEPIGVGDVVSLTIDDAHTYICEGLLSHNKTPIEEIGIIPVVRPSGPTGSTGSTGSIQFTINPAVATPITVKTPDLNRDLLREGRISSPALRETAASTLGSYGMLAGQPGQYDVGNFANLLGQLGAYNPQLTQIATQQTIEGQRALREANIADVQRLSQAAMEAQRAANPELYSTLGSYLPAAQGMLASDLARLQGGGRLTAEEIRSAQQSAREAGLARGREMDQSTIAAEVLNRDALMRAREAQARTNVQQSMQNVYGGIGAAQAATFNPFATLLGQQYGMQTANIGSNQALFGQGTGFTSGQFSNPFVQGLLNPYSPYAQDVYGSNFNAANARAIAEANANAAAQGANQELLGSVAGQVFKYAIPAFGSIFSPSTTPTNKTNPIT